MRFENRSSIISDAETSLENQFFQYRYYYDKPFEMDEVAEIMDSIKGNEVLTSFYDNRNKNELLDRYTSELSELKNAFSERTSGFNDYYLTVLEFMRFMCIKDNYYDFVGLKYFDNLNTSSVNALLLGKGNQYALASLVKDFSPDNDTRDNSYVSNIHFCKHPRYYSIVDQHPGCYILRDKDRYLIDPNRYIGYDYSDGYHETHVISPSMTLDMSEDNIKRARSIASSIIIPKYGIDKLSNDLVDESMDDEDKINSFIGFIKVNSNRESVPVKFGTINYNGRIMDCGKLFELLLIHNGINYSFTVDKERESTIYSIGDISIDTSVSFNNGDSPKVKRKDANK